MGKNKSKRKPRTEFSMMRSTMAKLDNEIAAKKAESAKKKQAKEYKKTKTKAE